MQDIEPYNRTHNDAVAPTQGLHSTRPGQRVLFVALVFLLTLYLNMTSPTTSHMIKLASNDGKTFEVPDYCLKAHRQVVLIAIRSS